MAVRFGNFFTAEVELTGYICDLIYGNMFEPNPAMSVEDIEVGGAEAEVDFHVGIGSGDYVPGCGVAADCIFPVIIGVGEGDGDDFGKS